MSFIITVYTNEGIVMASDSRITYNTTTVKNGVEKKQIGIQMTDNTYKTFKYNDRIGISTCGRSDINGIPIAGYIERFIAANMEHTVVVEDVAKKLLAFFGQYDPKPWTNFIIAGYNVGDLSQHVISVYIGSNEIIPHDTTSQGVVWDGEADVFQRLVKPVSLKIAEGTYEDLPCFNTGYNYFTLQDAIDYAEYAVDVTIKTMFFQNRVKTVGGPIDILVIKPSGSFWIQRKELHA